MSESDGESTDPGEVFAAVANEMRFSILRAVWDLTKASDDRAASFARIREAAGVRDSGQFNYHLQELMPRFVARVGEEGYVVTYAGARLVGAVVSGVYTDDGTSVEPRPVGECPNCGGTVEAGYETEQMRIECVDCEVTVTDMPAPPVVAAGHDPEDLPSVYSQYLYTETERVNRGFCPSCSGRIDTTVREPDASEGFEAHLDVVHECRECGARSHSALGAKVLDHPAVIALYYDAGIDVRETPIWELTELFETAGEIVGEDPIRVETTVEVDGEALDLLLDENLDVIEHERRTAPGDSG